MLHWSLVIEHAVAVQFTWTGKNFIVNILRRTPETYYVGGSFRSLFIHPESVCGASSYLLATSLIRHLSTCLVIAFTYVFSCCMCVVCALCCVLITAMPATRRNTADERRSAAPYSLSGASKPQLTAMTVAALKSHLKHLNPHKPNFRR